jgi:hypothetical protein
MGASFDANIIVGVRLSQLTELNVETKEFDEYNRKGQKTGKKFTENEYSIEIKGVKEVLDYDEDYNRPKIYSDQIKDADGCGDNLELIDLDYYARELKLKNFIVGKRLYRYDEIENAKEIDFDSVDDLKEDVANRLDDVFGYNGDVEVFIYKSIN